MSWRVVKSLTALRLQINAMCPGRKTGADGTIGDAAHMAESTSDHDPHTYPPLGSTPVVCALDITHDPAHGCDTYTIADLIRASHDPRVAYIISNRRIASNHPVGSTPAWAWRHYTGTGDPHTGHMHVSTVHDARADDEASWVIRTPAPAPRPAPTPESAPAMTGDDDMFLIRSGTDPAVYLADNRGHKAHINQELLDYLRAHGMPYYDGINPAYAQTLLTFGVDPAPTRTP